MAYPGMMDLQALAKLNDIDPTGEEAAALGARAIDADGDGRPDLYLVDLDGDGSVDGVVRAVDADGDGVNDTFIQYDEKGQVESIGRVDPASGELDVVYEQPDAFDEILGSLGLADLESPEQALFSSFEDPYIAETYGSSGEEVPDTWAPPDEGGTPVEAADLRVTEVAEEEAATLEGGAAGAGGAESEEPPEVVPRIVEIEDRSGDGSSLWAKVDENDDGLADNDVRLDKTSTGTYYGDINKDGYSENVATDLDTDGRIDTVDTTGRGSSADTVGADQIVAPGSDHLVDRAPGEDDDAAAGSTSVDTSADDVSTGADDDAGSSSSIDTGSDDDSGSSVDPGGSTDSGGSSGGDDTST
jgi:hypothetical protein